MRVLYSPQRCDEKLVYTFGDDEITVSLQESREEIIDGEYEVNWYETAFDTFDFKGMPDGKAEDIETTLPVNPIVKAEKIEGILSLTLLNYIGKDATKKERFPEWVVI